MKLHHKAFWIVIKALALAIITVIPFASFAGEQAPQSLTPVKISHSRVGPVYEFKSYDAVLGTENGALRSHWVPTQPALHLFRLTPEDERLGKTFLWGRMTFDSTKFGDTPLAIYSVGNRDQFKMFLNGRELYRNYVHASDHVQSWYRPFFIPIPPDALIQGKNEILFQNNGWRDLAVGWTFVGPQEILQDRYQGQMLARIYGPIVANTIMAMLGLCAVLLYSVRRSEPELLFLGLSTVFWLIRNYHFYNLTAPVNPLAFAAVTHFSMYFASASSASFCFAFLRTRFYKQIILALFGFGVFICGLHFFMPLDPFAIFLPAILITILTSAVGVLTMRTSPSRERFMVSAVMALFVLQALHDLLRHQDIWDGIGFYMQPYVGCAYASVFLLTFGTRAQTAFVELGSTNEILEARVSQVRTELAQSEANRRDLKVNEAIATERMRLMQEMHDGIGSNLITALAVAKKQNQPTSIIRTLKRALSDLKVTVDSLEPIEGDIVLLIANLRHRMAADLHEVGLESVWEVSDCRTVAWLDAASALHAVRILQEAIGNVIEHAQATQIKIGCNEEVRGNQIGVTAHVKDNGVGFDPAAKAQGKGLVNMKLRARSIKGQLTCESSIGVGTLVSLWLPLEPMKLADAVVPSQTNSRGNRA